MNNINQLFIDQAYTQKMQVTFHLMNGMTVTRDLEFAKKSDQFMPITLKRNPHDAFYGNRVHVLDDMAAITSHDIKMPDNIEQTNIIDEDSEVCLIEELGWRMKNADTSYRTLESIMRDTNASYKTLESIKQSMSKIDEEMQAIQEALENKEKQENEENQGNEEKQDNQEKEKQEIKETLENKEKFNNHIMTFNPRQIAFTTVDYTIKQHEFIKLTLNINNLSNSYTTQLTTQLKSRSSLYDSCMQISNLLRQKGLQFAFPTSTKCKNGITLSQIVKNQISDQISKRYVDYVIDIDVQPLQK